MAYKAPGDPRPCSHHPLPSHFPRVRAHFFQFFATSSFTFMHMLAFLLLPNKSPNDLKNHQFIISQSLQVRCLAWCGGILFFGSHQIKIKVLAKAVALIWGSASSFKHPGYWQHSDTHFLDTSLESAGTCPTLFILPASL